MAKYSIPVRKKVIQMFNDGLKPHQIAELAKVNISSVYAILSGRVRTKYPPKTKKEKREEPKFELSDFDSEKDYMGYQLQLIMADLLKPSYDAKMRTDILKNIADIKKRMRDNELEKHLKRPDAILISRIMRRLDNSLTDDDIIRIVKEEQELMKVENA